MGGEEGVLSPPILAEKAFYFFSDSIYAFSWVQPLI
jgi:hypothetical protein